MMWRRSTPSVLRKRGSRLWGYAQLDDGRLLGVYKDFLALVHPDEDSPDICTYEWIEIASARWEHTRRELNISFIDSSEPALRVRLSEENEDVTPIIHERIDSSFFWRQRQKLPSGVEAVFMIRSGKDSHLSIQVLYDREPAEGDREFIESMYERMYDLAGMTKPGEKNKGV